MNSAMELTLVDIDMVWKALHAFRRTPVAKSIGIVQVDALLAKISTHVAAVNVCLRETGRILDSLVGLHLSSHGIEERILQASRIKLTEPGTDCVWLFLDDDFDDDSIDIQVEKDETLASLREKLDEHRNKTIKSHGS